MVESSPAPSVSAHYTSGSLGERILAGLRATGKDMDALTPDDLAPVDQLHTGGKPATLALIRLAGFGAGARVLDVGGGLGGPARLLAATVGCSVTVLDLTEEFCRVGEMLTTRVGMTDRVTFQHGDALAMPFPDGSFDAVWTQHATMNIADKERLYAEMHRVVRPGGRLAMHEAMAGPVQPIHFPVPWASDPAINFLRPPEAIRTLLADTGFREIVWQVDNGTEILAGLRAQEAANPAGNAPAFGIALVIGPQFPAMLPNVSRNLREDRLTIVHGVFERS